MSSSQFFSTFNTVVTDVTALITSDGVTIMFVALVAVHGMSRVIRSVIARGL